MNSKSFLILVFNAIFLSGLAQQPKVSAFSSNQVDTFFGVAVADPYRWMEMDTSIMLKSWLENQKQLSKKVYNSFSDVTLSYLYLNMVSKRYTKNLIKSGQFYFGFTQQSEKSLPLLLMYRDEKRSSGTIVFDPNAFRRYNTEEIQVQKIKVSPDQKYLGILISRSGSDWKEILIYNINENKLMEDIIPYVRHDMEWAKEGFYYHTQMNRVDVLKFHQMNTLHEDDKIIESFQESNLIDYQFFYSKGMLLMNESSRHNGMKLIRIYCKTDADSSKHLIVALKSKAPFDIKVNGIINDSLILFTNFKSNNGKVLKSDLKHLNGFAEYIPEYSEVLSEVFVADDKLLCVYKSRGKTFSILYDKAGQILHKKDYSSGCFILFYEPEPEDTVIAYKEGSYFYTPVGFKYYLRSYETQFIDKEVEVTYDHRFFKTKYVEYPSKDGTIIPMFITYHQEIKQDGKNPVMVYGYGGFGVSANPFFDPSMIMFLNNKGILAHPAIRGGGDLGISWHEAGRKLNKQNSLDDFIAAAEYMIKEKYTSKNLLIANGSSNGGLLVTAVMIQRPDLFKVVVAEAPVTDMMRFKYYTSGFYWVNEYGSVTDSSECLNMLSYSPVHKIKQGIKYPATLIITGDKDDRVVPFHSYKLVAGLQNANPEGKYILYFNAETGHGSSYIKQKEVLEDSFKWLFIFQQLDINPVFDKY